MSLTPAEARAWAGQALAVGVPGATAAEAAPLVREIAPAGLIVFSRNVTTAEGVAALIAGLRAAHPGFYDSSAPCVSAGLGGRLLAAVDEEGGRVQRLRAIVGSRPRAADLGRRSAAEIRTAARDHGAALRALGFDWNFAPVLDVNSNPANPIIGDRAFGDDPTTVTVGALAFAAGLRDAGVLPCGKHFPGHGDTTTDSHLERPRVAAPRARLNACELPPFAAAVAAGLETLMTAHVVFDALDAQRPATLAPAVLTDLLTRRWGYDGVIVSDDIDMRAIADHDDTGAAAVASLRAGAHMVLCCNEPETAVRVRDAVARAIADDEALFAHLRTGAARLLSAARRVGVRAARD